MRNHYYAKLAWDNIRKNAKIYIHYQQLKKMRIAQEEKE